MITETFIPQRSEAWKLQRLGKFTASEIHKLMTNVKREMNEDELKAYKAANPKSTAKLMEDESILSEGAETYVLEKIAEKLTGESPEIRTKATDWGNEYEYLAKEMFTRYKELDIIESGFIESELFPLSAGGSPDGLVESDAIAEIKCPFSSVNHIQHMMIDSDEYFKKYFKEYYWQCQSNMLFSKRKKTYFVSFDPRIYTDKQIFVYEMKYDEAAGKLIEKKIARASIYMNELLAKINGNGKR